MHRIEIKPRLEPTDVSVVLSLFAAVAAADGHPPVDEHAWLVQVREPQTGSFAGLLAWVDGLDVPVGYAQVSKAGGAWGLEFVVDPEWRTPSHPVAADLARAALDIVAAQGGGELRLWVSEPRRADERLAAGLGLRPWRALYQMRRPLPVEDALRYRDRPVPQAAAGGAEQPARTEQPAPAGTEPPIVTRAFRPGIDEEAWLDVNNRAFAWHPEQGGWDLATLRAHQTEPWFDPDGFLMYEEAGILAGFCWTKIHAASEPPMGEIYVIAVNPDFARRGLGWKLTVAGLDHLWRRGLAVGMLYVDAMNESAVKLYIDLGFVVHHVDQSYLGDIAPA